MQNLPTHVADPSQILPSARSAAGIIPFLFLLYIVAYLDRVNVGFAAIDMNRDLGFSAAVYGLGSGLFFLSYTLLEVPSNLMLVRLGARVWIARIMFTWGVMSTAMMFVERPALLLSPALPAGRGGGRVLSRHDLLPDALVPRARARRRPSGCS